MFHVRAHMVGSGKSYQCTLMTAFATPQRATPTTFPSDDEECLKMLLAGLLQAPAVIEFDNLTGDLLAHRSLCTALSSEFMSGRILGGGQDRHRRHAGPVSLQRQQRRSGQGYDPPMHHHPAQPRLRDPLSS
jgi:hypothetical protein